MTLTELHKKFLPNPEDVILVKTLFSHPGWHKYEERLKENIIVLDYNIEQLTNGLSPLNSEKLPILNQQIAERRMLKLMLLLKEELLTEVDPEYEEQIEQKDFEVKEKN